MFQSLVSKTAALCLRTGKESQSNKVQSRLRSVRLSVLCRLFLLCSYNLLRLDYNFLGLVY